MLIKDEIFRNLYKKPIIIKDNEFARQMAQNMKIDSIFNEDISEDEIKEKLESIEVDESINAIFAIAYVDHMAGMSFLVLSTASINNDQVTIFKRDDFSVRLVSRKDNTNDCEFEYLENLKVNSDFDIDDYKEYIQTLDSYFVNEKVEILRFIDILDNFRNEDYPDDVLVLFYKEGNQIEQMWVRYENITEDQLIEGILLNTPYQDFGVKAGDTVKFFPYKQSEEDNWVLICDLN